jgi:hypothetical protein
MSFGVSPSDFINIPQFAWRVYQSCKHAPGDFKAAASEVQGVYIILTEINDSRAHLPLSPTQERRLASLGAGCLDALKELEDLLARFRSLGTDAPGKWDRLAWGAQEVQNIRRQLIDHTSLLTSFNSSITK